VAVPSLASGLMITRIGCYLFGCDFGRPLEATAPEWLKGLGSFPRWAPGLLHEGNPPEGAPAWTQHVKNHLINDSATTSLPVHPTQLYESLVGAGLLALLLYARTKQKFRGQIFLLFTFAYGVCRYMLEILRDDEERGSLPFSAGKDTMIALGLAIFAVGFALGFSKLIKNETMRRLSIALAFVPAVVMYLALAPASFGESVAYQWSTSQFVGITTGFAACVAFSVFYRAALAHPEAAMRIPLPAEEGGEGEPEDADKVADADDEDEDEDEKDEEIVDAELAEKAPAKKGAKKASSKDEPKARAGAKGKAAGKPVKRAAKKPAAKPADDEDDDADEDDAKASDDDAKASDDDASNDAKVGSSKAAARDDGDADDGDDDGEDKKS
ncbi:MAG: prolipoprotein diacylglyceryl transferase, partial [Polyangiaceae bacterium]